MKRCAYCGRENEETAGRCAGCGCHLSAAGSVQPANDQTFSSNREYFDVDQLPGAFIRTGDIVRVNWEIAAHAIEAVPKLDQEAAWTDASRQWLCHLRDDLGGSYAARESSEFLLLSDMPATSAAGFLSFAEQNVVTIREHLASLAWCDRPGKQVILVFGEEDDYYEYLAWFYDSNSIPASLGCHLGGGLPHIAIKFTTNLEAAQTLAHELTHGCLAHLPLPTWLNEGVAMRLQRATAGVYAPRSHDSDRDQVWQAISNWQPPLMWDELAERHHAFWNEENIQSFWAGTSWNGAQEAQELSYSLAEVLVHLLGENREAFLDFLSHAHYDDAGQTAAINCLDTNLGDAVGTFLGEGNWRPIRKAMVQCWEAARQPGPES